ncbi:TetR family transcriptional regulator [Bdellovibrio sp. 22V]|uniref:TetR/AcrR family transcriptional regulator n=1 Tax=Bdellovibrio sp. 22V TaxID=3044166 RepID=UPI0025435A99|nr:TetR family transcriptional regulator [Bdellovibrio sp. 22V]WII70863.1 TetR family transcriptional regulator [Bdellovibrio sp. 22V]
MNSLQEMTPDDVGARQRITEAAIVLFANEGLHGTSTRDIAKQSGLNLSLISYYFGGKEGLYRTVIQEFVQKIFLQISNVVNEFEQDTVSERSLRKAIQSLIQTVIDCRVANPHMAKIMTREKLQGLPFSREIHETMMTGAGLKLESIIIKAQEAGLVKKQINPRFFILCLVEGMLGYFNIVDCNCSFNDGLYAKPEHKNELMNQISLLFLEGILE